MKKLLCALLTALLLTGTVTAAYAADSDDPASLKLSFVENYELNYDYVDYAELFHHYSGGQCDWTLIYGANTIFFDNTECSGEVCGRTITSPFTLAPFETGYGVYDAVNDEFCDILNLDGRELPGLAEALDELNIGTETGQSAQNPIKDKFMQRFGFDDDNFFYNELYHHYNGAQSDWVLLKAKGLWYGEATAGFCIFDRRVLTYMTYHPFETGYGIYDAAKDEFFDLADVDENTYDGLAQALDELKIGVKNADADLNDVVDISDATEMQYFLASIKAPCYCAKKTSDCNFDGDNDINDVTCLQMQLAGLA